MTYPLSKFQNEAWVGTAERARMDRLKRRLARKIFRGGLRVAIEGPSDRAEESIVMLEEVRGHGAGILRMLESQHPLVNLVRRFLAIAWAMRRRVKRIKRRQMYKLHEPAVAQFLGNGD